MDLLLNALLKAYDILWRAFGDNDFTRQEAIDILSREDPKLYDEIYVDKITYELENAGILIKDWGISALDRRKSVYRLVNSEDFKKARELNRKFMESIVSERPFTVSAII